MLQELQEYWLGGGTNRKIRLRLKREWTVKNVYKALHAVQRAEAFSLMKRAHPACLCSPLSTLPLSALGSGICMHTTLDPSSAAFIWVSPIGRKHWQESGEISTSVLVICGCSSFRASFFHSCGSQGVLMKLLHPLTY